MVSFGIRRFPVTSISEMMSLCAQLAEAKNMASTIPRANPHPHLFLFARLFARRLSREGEGDGVCAAPQAFSGTTMSV
jgi:hypothetical protein